MSKLEGLDAELIIKALWPNLDLNEVAAAITSVQSNGKNPIGLSLPTPAIWIKGLPVSFSHRDLAEVLFEESVNSNVIPFKPKKSDVKQSDEPAL